jgi:hypothetical protein
MRQSGRQTTKTPDNRLYTYSEFRRAYFPMLPRDTNVGDSSSRESFLEFLRELGRQADGSLAPRKRSKRPGRT